MKTRLHHIPWLSFQKYQCLTWLRLRFQYQSLTWIPLGVIDIIWDTFGLTSLKKYMTGVSFAIIIFCSHHSISYFNNFK